MKKLYVHGDFPEKIYRVFKKLEHANEFLDGKLRFGNLTYYKHTEYETRRDKCEGEGQVNYEGIDHHCNFASNSFFVLCFHREIKDAINSNFGKYIVEIITPQNLAEELSNTLSEYKEKHFGGIEGVYVEYTFGEKVLKKTR